VGAPRGRTWSPRGRSCRGRRLYGDLTESTDIFTASVPRSYGASTALVLRLHGVLIILLRFHRDYTELPRRSLRSYCVLRRLQGVCSAL